MQNEFTLSRQPTDGDHLLQPGVLSCQGCGGTIAMKLAMKGLGPRTVVVIPACCWAIIVGTYPYSALQVPVLQVPFATAAVCASGVRAGLDARGEDGVTVMAWAGDGGTFDIGLQSLSGAAERNEDILYVCYDNEAYMNTGVQRSSATPPGAWTTTTPDGALKMEPKKDLAAILLAHGIPYLATASIAYPDDLVSKFRKARSIRGTRFIHMLSPCPPGWGIDPDQTVRVSRLAVQTRLFPLYEVVEGRTTVTVNPEAVKPVREYLGLQGRFGQMSDDMTAAVQDSVDSRWEALMAEAAG
ncbi:MAG: thiamine pyrophosphate-dependent enzyme [Desulfobacteraceae bacterium]|nr:thiamine pyrophosphate-dependent enzyme [Desulfobacteraceae bacterium]